MEAIEISKFKARCSAVLERVRSTGEPIVVTKRGEPVAEIVPAASRASQSKRRLGLLSGTARITGDIVTPAASEGNWESLAP